MSRWDSTPAPRVRARLAIGDWVRLTNPNYPDIDYQGRLIAGSMAGEPHTGVYGTYTVQTLTGRYRSEGVLERAVQPHVPHADIREGDVIDIATGISRTVERFVVHAIHWFDNGAASIRGRYASNPRGIDWSLFLDAGGFSCRVVSRGVSRVDASPRTLLPGA